MLYVINYHYPTFSKAQVLGFNYRGVICPIGVHLQAEKIIEFPIVEKDSAKDYVGQFFQRVDILPDEKVIALIQSTGWENKTWKAERFAQLGRLIDAKKNWKVIS